MNYIKLKSLPKIIDQRGNLSFLESNKHIPFNIKRVHWIYDIPSGFNRDGHAYTNNDEVIIALSGRFEVQINDGTEIKNISLDKANEALYIPKMHWREFVSFSTNSLALVLSSEYYEDVEYIRSLDLFLDLIKCGKYGK